MEINNENFNIQFVGLKKVEIENAELKRLGEIASLEARKIYRELKNDFDLQIHIKEHETAGKGDKKKKYSINIKLNAPGRVISSGKAHRETWKAKDSLHKALENIKNKVRSAYRGDSSWKKGYE